MQSPQGSTPPTQAPSGPTPFVQLTGYAAPDPVPQIPEIPEQHAGAPNGLQTHTGPFPSPAVQDAFAQFPVEHPPVPQFSHPEPQLVEASHPVMQKRM